MAKSIRSKWKRKCRAVKRIRYGKKELERLTKTIANDPKGITWPSIPRLWPVEPTDENERTFIDDPSATIDSVSTRHRTVEEPHKSTLTVDSWAITKTDPGHIGDRPNRTIPCQIMAEAVLDVSPSSPVSCPFWGVEEVSTKITTEFDLKTLRNKNGAFPVWVHPRKRKMAKKNKKKNGFKKGNRQ